MRRITAVLTQRSGDYHICVKAHPEIWSCGKSLYTAIDAFKKTAETFDLEMETLEVDVRSITVTPLITW